MALRNPLRYETYKLSESETLEASVLYPLQLMALKNTLAEIVDQKLHLTPNDLSAAEKESYWQQEAYLRGQLDIITHLLAASEVATAEMAQMQDDPAPVTVSQSSPI